MATIDDLLNGKTLSLNISGSLPGEQLISKILDLYMETRKEMSPELRAKWDAVLVQQIEDAQSIWRKIWVALGVLK